MCIWIVDVVERIVCIDELMKTLMYCCYLSQFWMTFGLLDLSFIDYFCFLSSLIS